MAYVLTATFDSGVYEIQPPNINNRSVQLPIPREVSGTANEIALQLEVFEDVWTLVPNKEIIFLAAVKLADGRRINAHLADGRGMVILVEALAPGLSTFDKFLVNSDTITVGSGRDNVIRYSNELVSPRHIRIEHYKKNGATLFDVSSNGSYINGKRINDRQKLEYGDVIYIFGLKLVWLDDIIAVSEPTYGCNISGLTPLTPIVNRIVESTPQNDKYYSPSLRQTPTLDDETIEIDPPPVPLERDNQQPKLSLGLLLAVVIPILAGVLFSTNIARGVSDSASLYMVMGIIISAAVAAFGVFVALANSRLQKRQERKSEKLRINRYSEYLNDIEQLLQAKARKNRELLIESYPDINVCLEWLITKDPHLWEHNVNNPDFLTVRLGMGSLPSPNGITVSKSLFSVADDALAERAFAIQNNYEMLTDVPVGISLFEHNLVGIIGKERANILETARIFAARIALMNSYTDVKMVFIVPSGENWEFAKWFPHTWSEDVSLRMIANDSAGLSEVMYHITEVIQDRREEKRYRRRPLPHYVVFVASPDFEQNETAIKNILTAGANEGFTSLLFYGEINLLPNACTVIVRRDEDSGYCSLSNAFPSVTELHFDSVTAAQIDEIARLMSGINVREIERGGAVPEIVPFLEMYRVSQIEDIDIYRNWRVNRSYESMKAVIGQRGGGAPMYLDIHEKYHGPHGLIAGTTGSGKSEMLQAFILSLAISYSPHEVSFIIIDYKGGGMAKSFEGIPHIAGVITNLNGNQMSRTIASILSELKRRQTVLNDYSLNHIDRYIELVRAGKATEPLPHLLIIVDEFAELSKEQPEFINELVTASRVGRSLGFHLILATQKPAGVVSEQIRSNMKFRICLRVQDKADSMEMLNHPEASNISTTGRGYFQVGNDEIFAEFQTGWSGAQYDPDTIFDDDKNSDVKMINLLGKPAVLAESGKKDIRFGYNKSQLGAIVRYISKIADEQRINSVNSILLPPLPSVVYLDELALTANTASKFIVPIGLIDNPARQSQHTAYINFSQDNHVLIAGSSSGGKTTLLQTILFGLATTWDADKVNIYIADYGSRTLGVFSKLPHCGGVIFDDDLDGADKLVALLKKTRDARKLKFAAKGLSSFSEYSKLYSDTPAIVFAIDNLPGFLENNLRLEDSIINLAKDAASYGIYLLVTCINYPDIRSRLRQNFRFGIALQMKDKFDCGEILGVRVNTVAEEHTPGRGLITDSLSSDDWTGSQALEFQTAICVKTDEWSMINSVLNSRFADIANEWAGASAQKIPHLPGDLSYEAFREFPEVMQASQDGKLAIGYDVKEASLVTIDPH
jgi:S-DNA-T family DNA segregation ATPase FtsK/SpoIIIE